MNEGWEPLCQFLEKQVPDKPFPWLNKNGDAIRPMMMNHAYGKQVQKETLFVFGFLVIVLGILIYFLLQML